MTALVIAEHDNASIKGATLNTVTAAAACGGEVHVLVAGHNAGAAAAAAAQIAGVAKVIHAEAAGFEHEQTRRPRSDPNRHTLREERSAPWGRARPQERARRPAADRPSSRARTATLDRTCLQRQVLGPCLSHGVRSTVPSARVFGIGSCPPRCASS